MKRALIGIALFMLSAAAQSTPKLSASSAVVIDADTHEVMYHLADTEVRPIASITKLMTAIVVLDANLDLDDRITITNDDVLGTRIRGNIVSNSLRVGAVLSRKELLHLMLMSSNNRAAHALGRTFPGGMQTFISMMNLKATTLGMYNTHFVEPTGLSNENVSTATELGVLANTAYKYAEIREFSTTKTHKVEFPQKRFLSFGTTNGLVLSTQWNIFVQKTGFINDAGRCVVLVAQVATRNVIIVLLNAPGTKERANDANKIRQWLERQ